MTERRHLAETGLREEGGRGRERREAAPPQRLQLEGCSPEAARRAAGPGLAGMNQLPPPEQEPRGQRERRLGGGVAAVSSVKLGGG